MSILLHNRGFRLLWLGQVCSTFATWSLRTVLLIWVYRSNHSGTAVSLVGLAEVIPLLALAPVGGVLIDRWPRVLVMVGGMAATALLLLPLGLGAGGVGLPVIIVAALGVNAVVQLSYAASTAAIPMVAGAEALGQANSLTSVVFGSAAVIAPALAALLVSTAGPRGAVLVLVGLFAIAGIAYSRVPAPRVPHEGEGASFRGELVVGLTYVARSHLLRSLLILLAGTSMAFGGLSVLDVVFVTRALHQPASAVGLLLSAAGFGELAGGIVMTAVAGRLSRVYHRLLGLMIIVAGVAFLLYSASHTLLLAAGALTLASLSYPPMNVAFATLGQQATGEAFRGRVGSLNRSTMGLAMLISLAAAGALTDGLGVRTVITAGGVILLGCGALSLWLVGTQSAPRMEEQREERRTSAGD